MSISDQLNMEQEQSKMEAIKLQRNDHGRGFIYYDPDEKEQRYNCWELLDESLYQALEKLESQLKAVEEERDQWKMASKEHGLDVGYLQSQLKAEREEKENHAKEFVRWMDQNKDLSEYRSLTDLYELFLTQNPK